MVLRFFLFAGVFLFVSCADTEFNNPYDPESPKYRLSSSSSVAESSSSAQSSSSAVVYSSSSKPGSSSVSSSGSNTVCTANNNTETHYCSNGTMMKKYGSVTDDDGQSYKTVEIGEQIWMAENLNYNVSGSKCYAEGISGVSDNSIAKNCATYGRLYDWATAMDIDAEFNSDWWDWDEINTKHRGICPEDWHIPNEDEWNTLFNFVGNSSSTGKYLKATSGWNDYGRKSGNGEDTFGFAALPGGVRKSSGGDFYSVGDDGYWWSSAEFSASIAYYRSMSYYEDVYRGNYSKSGLQSVRCLQD